MSNISRIFASKIKIMRINEDYLELNEQNKLFEFTFPGSEKLDEFNSLPLERIAELERDYRYYNHVSMGCTLSLVMSGRMTTVKDEDYSLILQPDPSLYANPELFEGLIKTVEAEKVIKLLPKEIAKYLIAQEWVQMMHVAPENCLLQMKKYFLLDKNQIFISKQNDGINYIYVIVPAIAENVEIVQKAMRLFGYYLNHTFDNSKINSDKLWYSMCFEPKFQPFVIDMLKKENKYLYQVSPSKYRHKILKNGLIPRAKNEMFNYPPRVYLVIDHRDGKVASIDFMKRVAEMLLNAISNPMSNEYVDDYKWSLYRIDVSKLPDDMKICFDENFYPYAVFSLENIFPDAIEYLTEFDFSKRREPDI